MARESTFRQTTLNNAQAIQTMEVEGYSGGALQLSGQWQATFVLEGTIDDISYFTMDMTPYPNAAAVQSATANGQWKFNCTGMKRVRARFSSYTNGNAILTMRTVNFFA